ncbi:MAG: aminotransferase [Rhodobacteraceae bacterium]|nr:aminotransferase [Paracoccaceae bacterium]
MSLPLNPHMAKTAAPPVMQAYRWLAETRISGDRPLINVSQAAPALPPPDPLRRAMAEMVLNDAGAHLYGPDLGLPALRAEVAARIATIYGGEADETQVAITSGCNQAFTAAIATLARAGDEVILPTPWYFNHQMWLTMNGIRAVPLATGGDLQPDPDRAAALITPRTRALVLVTPNNPGGVEYPPELMRAFFDLARAHGLALIVDETYRDFHARSDAPHDLFTDPDWPGTLFHLYSFSKAYRLTGHRVGALVADTARLAQVEKYLDSTTICASQLGQRAALWGMRNLGQWLAGERAEILDRRAAVAHAIGGLPGWRLKGCGAFFAYAEYPYDMPSADIARELLQNQAVLALPGSMFTPKDDPAGARAFRIAFANIDRDAIALLAERLRNLAL